MDHATQNRRDIQAEIEAIDGSFSGTVGFAALTLDRGEVASVNADYVMPIASAFKIPLMVETFAQAREGRFALDQRLDIEAEDVAPGTGVLADLRPGLRPSVFDLATLMIIVSDNTATNALFRLVGGPAAVNRRMHSEFGLKSLSLIRRIDLKEIAGDARRLAVATPRDMMALMALLARGEILSPDDCAMMVDIMGRQVFLDYVPRYIDWNRDLAALGVRSPIGFACKTGTFPGVRSDVGLLRLSTGTVAYAAITEGCQDKSNAIENEGSVALGKLGHLMVRTWGDPAVDAPMLLASPYL